MVQLDTLNMLLTAAPVIVFATTVFVVYLVCTNNQLLNY